jgi:hypothetical protein
MSAAGSAWITWGDGSSSPGVINARAYDSAYGWGDTVAIASGNDTLEVYSPCVMMDSSGDAVFTYMTNNFIYSDIYARSISHDNTWGGAVLLTQINGTYWDPNLNYIRPAVAGYDCAMSASGKACVVWPWYLDVSEAGHQYSSVWANYKNGSAWSGNEQCSAGFAIDSPRVASVHVLYDGGEVPWTFWLRETSNAGVYEIWYTHPPLTDPVIPTTEYPGENSNPPQYAIDENGNPFIVWSMSEDHADGTHYLIKFVRLSGSSFTASAPAVDTKDYMATYGYKLVNNPYSGKIGLVWEEQNAVSGVFSLMFKEYTGNGIWGIAVTVVQDIDICGYYSFNAGFDASGNGIVCWERNDLTSQGIWVNHYIAGQGLATPIKLSGNEGGMCPAIAVSANGQAIAVWQEGITGSTVRLKASLYK